MRIERIMPSTAVKQVQASVTSARDEVPQHQRQREERQVVLQIHLEQRRVEEARARATMTPVDSVSQNGPSSEPR